MNSVDGEKKLSLSEKSFLFICLSFKWGVRERKVISDILSAKEAGAVVHLYVLRDSSLAIKAKELNIPCTFHQGSLSISFIKWKKLKTIKKIISNYAVNVVHCYNINVLWPLSYYLKTKPLIPLVLSLVKPLKKSYRSFWYRPLSRRIDQVLITHHDMSENVYGFLGIPPIKVKAIDFGFKIIELDEIREKPFFRYSEERFYCGTHLSGLETSTTFLDPLFYALKGMISRREKMGRDITCVLGSAKNWRECLVTEEVRRKVKDWGLEDYIAFMGPCSISELQKDVDVWIDLSTESGFSDSWPSSLIAGTPLLAPRTGGSMDLLKRYSGVAELFRQGDTREMRAKLTKILMKLDTYQSRLDSLKEDIDKRFNEKRYKQEMASSYAKLIKRRKRLVMGRKMKKKS